MKKRGNGEIQNKIVRNKEEERVEERVSHLLFDHSIFYAGTEFSATVGVNGQCMPYCSNEGLGSCHHAGSNHLP